MGLELEPEWIPLPYPLNLGQKVQQRYGSESWSGVDPHELQWDIDGTGARDGADPKLRSKSYNPNMDLELDPEFTPQNGPHSGTHMVIKP